MFDDLKTLLRIDIFDLNYALSSESFDRLSLPNRPRKGIAMRIGSFLWHLFRSLWGLLDLLQAPSPTPGEVLLFAGTKNQRDALSPLRDGLPDAYMTGASSYTDVDVEHPFPLFLAYLFSLPFLPIVWRRYRQANGYTKRTFAFAFERYWLTYGFYLASSMWLRRLAPRALVLSNDHNMPNRVLAQLARRKGIPTFYIQHASVTHEFPPLSFDYALLEGLVALRKYERAGESSAKVYLIGIPKADAHMRDLNDSSFASSIGICTNVLDPPERVRALCETLYREFPSLRIVLRPHPGDMRKQLWYDMAAQYNVGLSESQQQISFEFLGTVDVVIAGDSSIHLEASMMNVYPIYYDFAQKGRDLYGFASQGLVTCASEPQEVSRMVEELTRSKPSVRAKAKPYCATIGTDYDGRSTELTVGLIQTLLSTQTLSQAWSRVPNSKLEAYEPAGPAVSPVSHRTQPRS